MLRGINRQDIFEDDEDCMQISKFPQYLPPNVWNADVHWVLEQVGVGVTPTWHLPKTYLNTMPFASQNEEIRDSIIHVAKNLVKY